MLKKFNKINVIGQGGFGKVTILLNSGLESLNEEDSQTLRNEINVQGQVFFL